MTASEWTEGDGTQGAVALGPMLSRRFTTYGADAERSIFQLVTATPFIVLLAVMYGHRMAFTG